MMQHFSVSVRNNVCACACASWGYSKCDVRANENGIFIRVMNVMDVNTLSWEWQSNSYKA